MLITPLKQARKGLWLGLQQESGLYCDCKRLALKSLQEHHIHYAWSRSSLTCAG